MLKKFLGIFKRDKSGISDEELVWQCKILVILFFSILVIWVLIEMTKNNIAITTSILLGICVLVVCVNNISRVIEQLIINKKKRDNQKLFEELKDKLGIDPEIPNEILEICLKRASIEITDQDETFRMVFAPGKREVCIEGKIPNEILEMCLKRASNEITDQYETYKIVFDLNKSKVWIKGKSLIDFEKEKNI